MDISKFLCKVLGIYLLIVSSAMLLHMPQFITQVDHLIHNETLLFVTGFFTLILGIVLIVSHNIWQWHWRTLVTIFAWLIFFKGASLLLYPESMTMISTQFMQNMNFAYAAAGFDFVLGLVFFYFGFRRDDKYQA